MNLNIPDQDYNRLKAETERIAQATDTIITPTVLASQNVINVHITGTPNNTELARVQILVFLDKLVKSKYCIMSTDLYINDYPYSPN